ncbi:hypothetical protein IE4771_PA00168 (plasmid) [Rhizobium etli bv. mimosae str. IE4771]|uniref:Uncharacterized protein n=2 Tax=Rhizobium etli TaxID=29449 RepID=A0A060I7H3_RHIET|nr:hypothetical protein IE4771_PA00168 [Rhizobium sp. IE4771]
MRNLVFGRGATDRRRRSVRKLELEALSRYLSVESGKLQAQDAAMLKTDTRQSNWRRANPAKYDAHLAVQRAVKAGELEKQTCEVCGIEMVDAHHDQYDDPLKVRWLCRRHHTRLQHYGFPNGL